MIVSFLKKSMDTKFRLAVYFANRYLSSDDSKFVNLVSQELTRYADQTTVDSVLLFPPLDSYHRLLIHKTVESDFKQLHSFSVGSEKQRRTVVCLQDTMLHNGLSQPMPSSGSRPCRGRGRGKWLDYQNSPPIIPSPQIIKDDDIRSNHDITSVSLQGTRGKARKPEQQLYIPRPRRMQQQQPQYPLDNDEYISPYCVGDNNDERGLTPTSPDDFYPHLFSGNPNNNSNVNTPQQTGRKTAPRGSCAARKTRREVEIYIPRAKRMMQQGNVPLDGLGESGSQVNCRDPASPLDRLSGEFSADWTVGGCQDVSMEVNRQGGKAGLQSLNVRNSRQSTAHRSPDDGRRGRQSKQWEYQSPSSSDDSGSSERKVTLTPAPQVEERNRNRPCGRKNRNALQPNPAGDNLGTYSPDPINKGTYVIQRCPGEASANASLRCTNERQTNESRGSSHKTALVNELTEVCDKTTVATSNPTRQRRRSPLSNSCDPNKLASESKSRANKAKCQSSSPHRPADQDTKQGIPSSISSEATPSPSSLEPDNRQTSADRQCAAIPVDIPKEETNHSDSLYSKSPVDTSASCKRLPSTGCKETDTMADKDIDNNCSVKNRLNKSKERLSNMDSSIDNNNVTNEDTGTKAAKHSSSPSAQQERTILSQNGSQVPGAVDEEDEGVDSWDALYDENGDCLDPAVMEELTTNVGKVQIHKTKINYLEFQPKESDLDYKEYDHVLEVYDFAAELQTRDLIGAFSQFKERGFDIKWVDDTHALAIFNSPVAAEDALTSNTPLLKVRRMADASKKSKQKAKRCTEFLQPYKPRPETSAITARRMVTGALGLTPRISKQKRDQERQQLKEAREKKRQDRLVKQEMWEGNVNVGSKCSVDATTQ